MDQLRDLFIKWGLFHQSPYGLDIAVAGSGVCLNADEYVVGWGTPVSFVGRVVGTLDVDDLQTGGRRTLPLVQCWDGNRLDLEEYHDANNRT